MALSQDLSRLHAPSVPLKLVIMSPEPNAQADAQPPPPSRDVPDPVQREVRQRCGFGCVVCGLPLYEYEHLLGWANVKRHVAEEITLLCDRHHREKTSGLLPLDDVRQADKDPFNKRSGVSKPYDLHFSGADYEVALGNNSFTSSAVASVAVSVDEIPLIGFSLVDGHLLLNVLSFDKYNNVVLHIANNRLVYSISPWDIQLTGRNLIIREAKGEFLLDMTFAVPNKIAINRGHLRCNGVEIVIKPEYVALANDGRFMSHCTAVDCSIGFGIGRHPSGLGIGFSWSNVPRYDIDRVASLKKAAEEFERVREMMAGGAPPW
jgi:trigger factor